MFVLGLEAKILYGTAGTTGSNLLENIKDVSFNMEKGTADTTTRKSQGWRSSKATLKDGTLEFQMNYDTEDEGFNAIQDAFLNDTPLAFFVTDGKTKGLDADWEITNFSREEPLEDVLTVSVSAKISTELRVPKMANYTSSQSA